MKKIWVHKSHSFKEAQKFDDRYYMAESPSERLSDIQLCREWYFKIKGVTHANRKGLRRVIKIVQQA